MKRILIVVSLGLTLALLGSPVLAKNKVICGPEKVENLFIGEDKAFIQLTGQSWHVLAHTADEKDLNKKLARLRQAKAKGRLVELTLPKGYDPSCLVKDDTKMVTKVKVKKHKHR